MEKKPKIGLVLGSGGARGIAHIGVLKVLEDNGIKPDFIIGVSMGSVIGACYALGFGAKELEIEALSFTKRKIFKHVFDLANPRRSLIQGVKIEKYLNNFIDNKKFSDCQIPLSILTTNLASGDELIIEKGELAQAVMASCSVPGIFPPVKIGEHHYIDGGVVNPTPVDLAAEKKVDIIIGVDLTIRRTVEVENPRMLTTLLQTYEIIRRQAVEFKFKNLNKDAVIIKPKFKGIIDSFKFFDAAKFVRIGEEAAKEKIEEIRKIIES
jgi:NTE family protein